MIDKKTVTSVAKLARLEFPEAQIDAFTDQLNQILGHVEKLGELDTKSISATSHTIEMETPMREDKVVESEVFKQILDQSPAHEDNFFVVPKVL
ncbi:MAG: Asp-tRNA(Asn)/Glu-tRNA(Gln) amidotransferase subunit GatC [Deltaproteobacteria bacterium]|nr:Asp-tRNA(Asn)/Glu-tRNA(Gln) amidotransferase subunit GatC [Deltaproteobacteria bacterium]